MKKTKLNLPRKYEIKESTPEKYHKYKGQNKLSYSQITSWLDPKYKEDYILQYIFGLESPSSPWADYGSAVGEYLETQGKKVSDLLNDRDKEILDGIIVKLSTLVDAEYEREIIVERNGYILQGFIDLYYTELSDKIKMANTVDFKTLSLKNKAAFYASDQYQQTTLYSRALELEGEKIKNSGVFGIDRTFEGTFEEPTLHLSGETKVIPTPYTTERAEKFLKKSDRVAEEISSLKTTHDKLKLLTFEM